MRRQLSNRDVSTGKYLNATGSLMFEKNADRIWSVDTTPVVG